MVGIQEFVCPDCGTRYTTKRQPPPGLSDFKCASCRRILLEAPTDAACPACGKGFYKREPVFPAGLVVFSVPLVLMALSLAGFHAGRHHDTYGLLMAMIPISLGASMVWPLVIGLWYRARRRQGKDLAGWSVTSAWVWAFLGNAFVLICTAAFIWMFMMACAGWVG
jgi:predicted RNA-binding Zn-ribbon protein involved in translation (DUF1610 family)